VTRSGGPFHEVGKYHASNGLRALGQEERTSDGAGVLKGSKRQMRAVQGVRRTFSGRTEVSRDAFRLTSVMCGGEKGKKAGKRPDRGGDLHLQEIVKKPFTWAD